MDAAATEALRQARAAGRKVPDFWIVGHPKSGTTALYEMLRSHPEVFMPELKETLFFARELHPGIRPSDPQPDTLEQYLALFAPARPDQRAGEASPSYLRSRLAPGKIAEVQPEARIVAILREPASFLRSMHLELLKDHVETEKDFRRAMEREQRIASQKPVLWYAEERVEYAAQLRRWHEAFGQEQVLVLIYDDFRADNEGTVRTVRRFLGVDDTQPVAVTDANPSVISMRSQRADEILNRVSVGRDPASRLVKTAVKAVLPGELRRRAIGATQRNLVMGPPPPPEEEVMVGLRRRFKGEVAALSEYLDRDLVTLWGYDRID